MKRKTQTKRKRQRQDELPGRHSGRARGWMSRLAPTPAVPAELRVDHPAAMSAALGSVEALLQAVGDQAPREEAPARQGLGLSAATVAALATHAWRTQRRMVDPDTGEPLEEMRRAYRHVEALLAGFSEAGIEINDPVGRNYDPGMALKVVAFEATPGVMRERIAETVKPSIRWNGQLLQTGEVVVATPVVDPNPAPEGGSNG